MHRKSSSNTVGNILFEVFAIIHSKGKCRKSNLLHKKEIIYLYKVTYKIEKFDVDNFFL